MYFFTGFNDMKNRFVPEKVKSFKGNFVSIGSGQHHTVALDNEGKPNNNTPHKVNIDNCNKIFLSIV